MRRLAPLLLLAGCDTVFGLDEAPTPCTPASFANASTVDVAQVDDASVSLDRTFAVVVLSGLPYVQPLPAGSARTPMTFDSYTASSLALAPEGNALLFTAVIEPPTLMGAVRVGSGWQPDPIVPVGTYAGTPSEDGYGVRRVLVRVEDGGPVQEYEQQAEQWVAVGDPQALDGDEAPSLTANGLTMVYGGSAGIMQATRATTSQPFATPLAILPGAHTHPQLLDHCQQLYVIDPPADGGSNVLRRYDL